MKAVVLVGGQGTRLRPLTLSTPKQLLPIAEVVMLERVVGHLAEHGVDEVVLSMGYQPDAFAAVFPDDRCAGVPLSYAVEPEPMDTAGAIRFAAAAAAIEEPFLAVNGDVITDLDVSALVAFHEERGAEATIALTPVDDPSSFGVVPTDGDGRVVAFIEKPPAGEAPTNLINAGFYVLQPSVLDRIPSGQPVNIERETFPALAAERRLFARRCDGYWIDTGTPALYLQANLDLVSGRRPAPPAPGATQRDDGVWTLGAGVIDGTVEAPALVGDAAYIAHDAWVGESVIGAGSRVEAAARVHASVVLPGAVVGSGARVEASIVGEGAKVEDHAVVTGLSVVQGGAHIGAGVQLSGARVGREA